METAHVVMSGIARVGFRDELIQRVAEEHPDANELRKIGKVVGNAHHRLWIDEGAGVLLHLEWDHARPGFAGEGSWTLHRIPVTSTTFNDTLSQVMAWPLWRLANPDMAYWVKTAAEHDLSALRELFQASLTRLQVLHSDPAELVKAIKGQIEQARTADESVRARAFLGWYLRRTFGPGEAAGAHAVGCAPEAVGEVMDTWRRYCREFKDEVVEHRPAPRNYDDFDGSAEDFPLLPYDPMPIRHYVECRTLGRRLTGRQVAKLRTLVPGAKITPEYLLFDQTWIPYVSEVPWAARWEAGNVVARYFDAALSFEQEGEFSVWFRLPAALAGAAEQYRSGMGAKISVETEVRGDDLLLTLTRYGEGNEGAYRHTDPTPWLWELLPLRDALSAGDLRALQIARQAKVGQPIDYATLGIDETTMPHEFHALERFLTEVP